SSVLSGSCRSNSKAVNVGSNGPGRIGRAPLRVVLDVTPDLDLVAVNDIGSLETMAYLLKYDTVYGRYHRSVETRADKLIVGGKEIAFLSERDPANLPVGELGVELGFEGTGIFTNREDAANHIHPGR